MKKLLLTSVLFFPVFAQAQYAPKPAFRALTLNGGAILPACPLTGCLSGPTFFTNQDMEVTTTHSNDAQETGMLINMMSNTGAAAIQSGSAALNNGKEGESITLLAGPNTGATWGLIVDAAIQASNNQYSTLQGHTTIEADTNNAAYDAAPGVGGLINGYWAGGSNALPGTAMFYGDQGGSAATYSWHYGFLLNDSKLVKDADFYSITKATSGIVISGGHTTQDMLMNDSATTGIEIDGSHATADINDAGSGGMSGVVVSGHHAAQDINVASTSPAGINFSGNHSTAIINMNGDTSNSAILMHAGQLVCFDGQYACVHYDSTVHKWYFTNSSNTNIMSISDAGNMTITGTLTQSGTP